MNKFMSFIHKITPSKRKLIQLYSALLYNANIKGFIEGSIYTGKSKSICLPGMNCYSCPGAVAACPLGSLQNALSESNTKVITYVIGIILLFSIICGRTICGWFCPGGWLQELLYKIRTPKLKKNRATRILSYFKYVLLAILVIAIPIIFGISSGKSIPAFCKYICPIGTFEGAIFLLGNKANSAYFDMLGPLFTWKFVLLVIFIVASVFIYRFFCRFFCPLGAIYGLFNKISILGIKVDKSKCNSCGSCVSHCKMDVRTVGDQECIMCGECKDHCPTGAIDWKKIGESLRHDKEVDATPEAKPALDSVKKKKIITGAVTTVMLLFLAFVYVFVNVDFNKSTYIELNSQCDNLVLNCFDDTKYNIKDNDKYTVLYFYDHYEEDSISKLYDLATDDIDVVAISNYSNRELNKKYIDNTKGIIYTYDTDSKSNLAMFNKDKSYPYYVWLDDTRTVKYSSDKELSNADKENLKEAAKGGLKIGNKIGDKCIAYDVTLLDKDGNSKTFNINDYAGKVIVINFWATWCGPCVQELPYFETVYQKYKDDIVVVALHDGASFDNDDYMSFVKNSARKDYQISFGYDGANSDYFKALGGADTLPMTVIVDKNGIITYNSMKSVTVDLLEAEITKNLN